MNYFRGSTNLNKKEYKISISPEILELLGPSLYTNIYYVLAELIANSYDADAENVWIEVNEHSLSVEDDGKGMSYDEGEIDKYLSVAKQTRISENESFTSKYKRPKMGRKGIGKLAALAVSSRVKVMTKAGDDLSGFWLDREIPRNNKLEPINVDIKDFKHCQESGTRIEMLDTEFQLPKTTMTIKNNLSKFFPQLSSDKNNPFVLHIRGKDGRVLKADSFVDSLAKPLDSVIVYGKDNYGILRKFADDSPKYANNNLSQKVPVTKEYEIKNNEGDIVERKLTVNGWIGTYNTTRGLKAKESADFPENFLAVYSHGKLGKFNILGEIGQNRLNEVYVVGQLYVDEFEETSLPDMALSNRQGYKSDDIRYTIFLQMASKILDDVLRMKDKAVREKNKSREDNKLKKRRKEEEQFKKQYGKVIDMFNNAIPDNKLDVNLANTMMKELGIKKQRVDEDTKKIFLSHTKTDDKLNNIIYGLMLYNGFLPKEIIYTNDPDCEASVPFNQDVYEYLREFFVRSYSDKELYVVYIHSNASAIAPGVQQEVGAGWIVKSQHCIIKAGYKNPEAPLKVTNVFPSICICDDGNRVVCTEHEFGVLFQLIEDLCKTFSKKARDKKSNLRYFEQLGGEIITEVEYKNILKKMEKG